MLDAVKQSLLTLETLEIRKVSENILYEYNLNQKFLCDSHFEWGLSLVNRTVINIFYNNNFYNNEQKIVSGSKHKDIIFQKETKRKKKIRNAVNIYIYKLFIQINCFNYKFVYNFNIVNISTPNAIL